MSDQYINFKSMAVTGLYDAAATDITVDDASGIIYHVNMVWYNHTAYPNIWDDPNKEIVRATSGAANVITVTRAQEGTLATTKNTVGSVYKLIIAPTAKTISDLVSEIALKGDMNKAEYDTDDNGIVDKAEALDNGEGVKTYSDISTEIDDDIITHNNLTNVHGVDVVADLPTVMFNIDSSIDAHGNIPDAHHDEIHTLVSHDTTVTGAELNADHLKLSTVEDNARDDQTGGEIVTAINGVADIIDDENIASTIARDSEVTADISTHAALPNIHHNQSHDIDSHTGTSLTVDTINEHTTHAGVTVEGVKLENSGILTDNLRILKYSDYVYITEHLTANNLAGLRFNVNGYNGTTDYYRTFGVYDGKDNVMFGTIPSDNKLDIYCDLMVDQITEHSVDNGVTIEGVELKDGGITAQRTRRMFIAANVPTTTGDYAQSLGVDFDPDTDEQIAMNFMLPLDYVSMGTLKVYYCACDDVSAGNIVLDFKGRFGTVGEDYNHHEITDFNNTIAIAANDSYFTRSYTIDNVFSGCTIDDVLQINIIRDADNASDTSTARIAIRGLVLEYTANQ